MQMCQEPHHDIASPTSTCLQSAKEQRPNQRRVGGSTSTCRTANHSGIFFVRTVVPTPAAVWAFSQIRFRAIAVHICQPDRPTPFVKRASFTRCPARVPQ